MKKKPECKLVGENGNIFNLLGAVIETLKKAGMNKEVKEVKIKIFTADNYSEALSIISEYVEIY